MRRGQFCVCTAAFPPQLQKMQEVMRHTPGRGLFHIHLLIHAHCISICFPPITNITQSQSLSPHIFHLSLSPLSSINLNIWTPTERFRENAAVAAETSVFTDVCSFPLFPLRLCVSPGVSRVHCRRAGDRSRQRGSVVVTLVCPPPQGSLGE